MLRGPWYLEGSISFICQINRLRSCERLFTVTVCIKPILKWRIGYFMFSSFPTIFIRKLIINALYNRLVLVNVNLDTYALWMFTKNYDKCICTFYSSTHNKFVRCFHDSHYLHSKHSTARYLHNTIDYPTIFDFFNFQLRFLHPRTMTSLHRPVRTLSCPWAAIPGRHPRSPPPPAAAMREEELEIALKVVIVGNGAVGKSSMIQRYCKGTYTKDYKKTIGVDFLERHIE